MENSHSQLAAVKAREDVRVRGDVIGDEATRRTRTEFVPIVTLKEPGKQIIMMKMPFQPVLDCCPAQNKHFFCGMAKKLGCQFCATT